MIAGRRVGSDDIKPWFEWDYELFFEESLDNGIAGVVTNVRKEIFQYSGGDDLEMMLGKRPK